MSFSITRSHSDSPQIDANQMEMADLQVESFPLQKKSNYSDAQIGGTMLPEEFEMVKSRLYAVNREQTEATDDTATIHSDVTEMTTISDKEHGLSSCSLKTKLDKHKMEITSIYEKCLDRVGGMRCSYNQLLNVPEAP